MDPKRQDGRALPALCAVMDRLLADDGCPWDREQTLESLRPYVIEEVYEVVDAIDGGDVDAHREELGDLLFQIVFQSAIRAREGAFGIDDVARGIQAKMERRHPWVFGDENETQSAPDAPSAERWEAMKAKERNADGKTRGTLDGVPRALPALLRAYRVGEKAGGVGFDWSSAEHVRAKVDEELTELDAAETIEEVSDELGDVLFALCSYARHRGVDPEASLRGALDKFTRRFERVEALADDRAIDLRDCDDDGLDALWNEAKARLAAEALAGGGVSSAD